MAPTSVRPTRRSLLVLLPVVLSLAACDTVQERREAARHARADSVSRDSVVALKNELLDEVMQSTQFVDDINGELAKARLATTPLALRPPSESEAARLMEQRRQVVGKIARLVARLDSAERRLAATRARARAIAPSDPTLLAQVAEYEKTIAGLRATARQQQAEYQAVLERQGARIATLDRQVDTLRHRVGQMASAQSTAYYVVGSREELLQKHVLMKDGRNVRPFIELDPASFTRIDINKDRVINLPDGEYKIMSPHNPGYAFVFHAKDGRISRGLRVDLPERFWASSKFLILMKV